MKQVPVWIFGLGGVGRTLLRMLAQEEVSQRVRERVGAQFVPMMVADTTGCIIASEGMAPEQVAHVLCIKEAGGSLLDIPETAALSGSIEVLIALEQQRELQGSIGIDMTAGTRTVPALLHGLDAGAGLVLANKRPFTESWEQYRALAQHRRCRYEVTVGAGLPVISTLTSLLDSGDSVRAILGCLSGTLGYICAALNGGKRYSQAVREAVQAGYAEPDPREDLCGMDVARKALILSRLLGRRLEMNDLDVRPMIPDMLAGLEKDEFLHRLPEADAEMETRVSQARWRGKMLSYVADLSSEGPVIGLQEVDQDSPMGRLRGTDNVVVIYTDRYPRIPVVIQGPGAGREVTAAGALADMISLVREGV